MNFLTIEFLKDPRDVWEFRIGLLSLNVSMKKMYQIICS